MSWQSSFSYGVGEDPDAFLESLVDFDGGHIESPELRENGQARPSDDSVVEKPKVLTIIASIDAIQRHLENEREKANGGADVAIKLKDLHQRKSITFFIPELQSPITTTASSSGTQSCTPSRLPSPEPCSTRSHIPDDEAATKLSERAITHTEEDTPCGMASPTAILETCVFPRDEDSWSCISPLLESASPTQATELSTGQMPPRATVPEPFMIQDGHAITSMSRRHSASSPPQTTASQAEIGQDASPYTASFRSTRSRQAAEHHQKLSAVSSKEQKCGVSSRISNPRPESGSSSHQKRHSIEGIPNTSIKRRRADTPDLTALLPSKDEYKRVQELTAGQDPSLIYKMVRNARAIIPLSAAEVQPRMADMDVDASIRCQNSQHSPSNREDIAQRFWATIRRIEWVERLAFRSMAEYRVLFVQLYQHYLALQKFVVTQKGEKRVTLAKMQLYETLYPNVAKANTNGRTSDEWEKFNRCIRRGKQWHTYYCFCTGHRISAQDAS